MRLKIAILYLSLLVFGQAFSQSVKMLPDDPRIQKGSIANGFTYYHIYINRYHADKRQI